MASLFLDCNKHMWIKGRKIGDGGFANVYECKYNKSVVLKIFKTKSTSEAQKEIAAYNTLNQSKFIPNFMGHGVHDEIPFLVIERFNYDLHSYLMWGEWNENRAKSIARNIIDAMHIIHDKNKVHCDIKPHNILLKLNKAVLSDFGMLTPCNVNPYKENVGKKCGTLNYLSCDVHAKALPTRRSDIESFGWVIIELFKGILPWKHDNLSCEDIFNLKTSYKEHVEEFLEDCFGKQNIPPYLFPFYRNIWTIGYHEQPNYEELKQFF